jgi:hypothetical protein
VLEHFEQNPLDLISADADVLRSLPGFPEPLVQRIIEARVGSSTVAKLLAQLTPPDREILRRYEAYISLPGRLPVRLEARFTADRIGKSAGTREDMRCAFESDLFRARARRQGGEAYRHYASGALYRRHIRVHGGDFAPDLAMGLLFSSYSSSYPFSHGYHIRRKRWIAGISSFYGASMRGAAVEIWMGRAKLLLFGGKRCNYDDGHLEANGSSITGGRLEVSRQSLSLGVTACRDGESQGGITASLDAHATGGCFEAAGEIVLAGRKAGCMVALCAKSEAGKASIALYDIDCDPPGDFGRPLYGRYRTKRGVSIVLRRRFAGRRIEILSAFEHLRSSNVIEDRKRDLVRLECRWSARRVKIKLSYRLRTDSRCVMIPFPPSRESVIDESSSLALLQNWKIRKGLRIRISFRAPLEREARGYLICPSVTIGRASFATASYALHRATSGNPVFYCYERSLEGLYPWRALRGDGWRVALIGELHVGPLRLGIGCSAQKPGGREACMQARLLF